MIALVLIGVIAVALGLFIVMQLHINADLRERIERLERWQ